MRQFGRLGLVIVLLMACATARAQTNYQSAVTELHALLGRKYCCFAMKKIDWDAVGRELLPRAKDVDDDEAFGRLCMQMLARLQDSHAILQPGRAPLPKVALPMWDAGFGCLIDDQDRPVAYWVDPNGPATKAGLLVGSVVVSVNGKPARDALDERMTLLRNWYGFSSERVLQYDAARWLAHQPTEGDPVRLAIQNPGDSNQRDIDFKATMQTRSIPRLPVPIPGIRDSANVGFTELGDDIGYLRVRRIREDLPGSVDAAIKELGDVKGLIIDVRGNSGGGFDDAALRNFTNEGREPLRPRYTGKIALLIDERCISAGEGWSSWFVANKKAKLFGTATAGASSRKETHAVMNGLYNVVVPVKAYTGYLDRPIERRGLEPDVAVRCSAKDLAAGKDTVLETARAYLREALK